MKRSLVLLCVLFGLLSAREFSNDYITHCLDYSDSIRLPPRMRGVGDAEYFDNFIKPRSRDSLNVRCVGRWPFGPGFEVYGDTVNDILCFGSGAGVLVFDISNPSSPVRFSQIAANGLIMQIYMRDSLLFVSSYGNGIEVFDLADPSMPAKISQISVPARDFCLKDTFAYCVAEDSLRIVNIADLDNPFQVGACWDSSYTISISGNYVYTGGRWKLSAINVSNPQNPQVVSYLPVWVYTLTADGNHLYCVLNTGGFTIYNISNPLNIWQESQLSTVGGVDIYKLGYFVYLPGFVVVDVSDPINPYVIGDTSLPVYAQAVWANDPFGYAYVANDYVGLTPVNINNPTNPIASASIYGADDSRDVFVQGDHAYVSNLRKGLKILDVSDPSMPMEVGEYDTVGISYDLEALWVRDSIAYLSVGWPLQFRTININNPSAPIFIGECILLNIGADMIVRDSLAYSLGSGRILQIVKIADPSSPDTFPRYYLPDFTSARAICLQDTFAYIADGDSGLRILNVANPAAPYEVGYSLTSDAVYGLYVTDSLAYLAALGAGLRIVNIGNPAAPQEISYYIAPGWTRDVWIVDTIAYVAASGCIEVLNIVNPAAPFQVGYYNGLTQSPRRIFYRDPYLFYAAFETGMGILEWYGTGIEESDSGEIAILDVGFELSPTVTKRFVQVCVTRSVNRHCDIVIYDKLGRAVMDICTYYEKDALVEKTVDLGNLANGVYFMVLKSEPGVIVKKFIVVH
jgi:hypothetical protein